MKGMKKFAKLLTLLLILTLVAVPLTGGMVASAATETDIQNAINKGLAYLAATQNADGSWNWSRPTDPYSTPKPSVGATGEAVLAFEQQGYLPTGSASDPYVQAVQRGLAYIFSKAEMRNFPTDPDLMNYLCPYGNPDTDGDGRRISWPTGQQLYETGIALQAIVSSLAPTLTASIKYVQPGQPDQYPTLTYKEIAQDTIDFLAWAQNDYPTGEGGWRYGPNNLEFTWVSIDACDDAGTWTAAAGVTLENSPEVPTGSGTSLKIIVPAGTTGWVAYKTAVAPQDWTIYTSLRAYVRTSVAGIDGGVQFGYDEDAAMASPEWTSGLPSANADEWRQPNWGLPSPATTDTTRDAVVTWGIKIGEGKNPDGMVIFVDQIDGYDRTQRSNSSESDNSVSMWPPLAMYAAEKVWGMTIPTFVKPELSKWIDYIQQDSTGGSGYTKPDEWVNIAKTGSLLVEQAFFGDTPTTARVQAAVNYVDTRWKTDKEHLAPPTGPANGVTSYYAIYSVMKGMSLLGIDILPSGRNWYQEYAAYIVPRQNANGSWGPDMYGDEPICTAWAILTLCRKVIPPTELITKKFELVSTEDGDMVIEVRENVVWLLRVTVCNTGDLKMTNVVVNDNLGGELELDQIVKVPNGTSFSYKLVDATKKVQFTWTIGELAPHKWVELLLQVSTDKNPDGKQQFNTAGTYQLNSGAQLKYKIGGQQFSAKTAPVRITVK